MHFDYSLKSLIYSKFRSQILVNSARMPWDCDQISSGWKMGFDQLLIRFDHSAFNWIGQQCCHQLFISWKKTTMRKNCSLRDYRVVKQCQKDLRRTDVVNLVEFEDEASAKSPSGCLGTNARGMPGSERMRSSTKWDLMFFNSWSSSLILLLLIFKLIRT